MRKLWFLVIWIVLVACSGAEPPPTAFSAIEATTEMPIATDVPTNTVLPTPTLLPTPVVATSESTTQPPTEEATIAPTATVVENEAVNEMLVLSADFPFISNNRNPLTGELVENPENLQRRPILCKISNSPPEWVRPQSGLNSADIVFEHYTEGVITRFTALFYGKTPETVGPIRSARLIDLELPLMYDGALCFSGGSSGVGQFRGVYNKVFDTQFAPRILRTDYPGYYRTGENKPFEHTFYNRLTQAWEKLTELGQNQAPQLVSQVTYSEQPPLDRSAAASTISISYGDGKGDFVEWTYDAELGKYRRAVAGAPIIDALDGEQVTASNVVVLRAPHVIDRNICETQGETRCLAFSTEIQIWGGGFVSVFRDGRQINGSWSREDRDANGMMFTYFDEGGEPIPLQIGNTWVQIVPYSYIETPIEVTP